MQQAVYPLPFAGGVLQRVLQTVANKRERIDKITFPRPIRTNEKSNLAKPDIAAHDAAVILNHDPVDAKIMLHTFSVAPLIP